MISNPKNKIKFDYEFYSKQVANLDRLFRRTGKGFPALRDLKADAHVWSGIQQRKSGVLSLNWKFIGNVESYIDEITENTTSLFSENIFRDILEAPFMGFQPIEVFWEFSSGKLIPSGSSVQFQENFTFDSDGKLMMFSKHAPVPVPPHQLICPRFEANKIQPFGQSLLAKCYWLVQFKTATIRNWIDFCEKFGNPIVKGSFNGTNTPQSKLDDLATSLASMAGEGAIVHDKGLDIELLIARGTISKELYNGLKDFCNSEITKSLLSQTLTTEVQTGSYAAASIHYKVQRGVIESDIKLVESSINSIIKSYFTLNHSYVSLKDIPIFKIIFTNQDNKDQIDRDVKINSIHSLSKTYLTKEYDLNDEDFEVNNV